MLSLQQLRGEWRACLRAPGYPGGYARWLLKVAHFVWVPWDLPDPAWLQDASSYTQYECVAEVRRRERQKSMLWQMRIQQDMQTAGSASGFRRLRPRSHAPVHTLPVLEEQQTVRVADAASGDGRIRLQCPHPEYFQVGSVAAFQGVNVQIHGVEPGPLDSSLLVVSSQEAVPALGKLRQNTSASSPQELSRQFAQFWVLLWNRDGRLQATDVFQWEAFMKLLPDPPPLPEIELDLMDLEVWKRALRKLKPSSSPGYCGCYPAELRWLPDEALRHLMLLFRKAEAVGFPRHLMRAWVANLPKVAQPNGVGQLRPITVLSALFRLWSSVIARATLEAWSKWFPAGIRGSLPGRSPRHISLLVELRVEQALYAAEDFLGFSLDLTKYYNFIPRAPGLWLMQMLGCPSKPLQLRGQCLQDVERLPRFQAHLGVALPSQNGVPEGDPMSVACQAALGWFVHEVLSRDALQTLVYIDNLAWLASSRLAYSCTLQGVQQVCSSLSLQIDWRKSYSWAVLPSTRTWLSRVNSLLLPEGCELPLVNSAKDLGVCFRYRKAVHQPTS